MKKIRKFKVAISTFTICTLIKLNSVSAAVSFNQGQATTDVKALLDPIANVNFNTSYVVIKLGKNGITSNKREGFQYILCCY